LNKEQVKYNYLHLTVIIDTFCYENELVERNNKQQTTKQKEQRTKQKRILSTSNQTNESRIEPFDWFIGCMYPKYITHLFGLFENNETNNKQVEYA
jgi:hypothetical protein